MRRWVQVTEGRWRLVDGDGPPSDPKKPAPFVRNEHIDPAERRKLAIQLGENFDSESALRRYLKDNGMRLRERGDKMDTIRKARKEWLRDTKPGQRGRNPVAGPNGYSHY